MKTLKMMRVHHYIKNLLILFPLVFAGQLSNTTLLLKTLLGCLAFCFVSSIIYIVNDLKDKEKDANHPTKCKRPIASGEISESYAKCCIVVLAILSVCLLILSQNTSWACIGCVAGYFILNLAYSFGLKNKPIIDIAILVSGFLLRIIFGSAITGIEVSSWLYLTVMSFSFYLALGKRRNEFSKSGTESREVLKYYSYEFLDKNMILCLALTDVFYALWAVTMIEMGKYGSLLLWTIPFVILIEFKYSLDIEGDYDGDPVEVLFRDKTLIGLVLAFVIFIFVLIYIL